MATADAPPPPPPQPDPDAASLPAGCSLNDYQIERSLGGGGFGITYLARDRNLDLTVAIKEYFPSDLVTRAGNRFVQVRQGVSDEAQQTYAWGLERFLDEARALATFRHPNIVRVLRYFRENGTAYIVMEYESGLSLKQWVPQNAPLSQRSLLGIVYPLLEGLEAVHKAGFLHRDIKPDNIYVRADGAPVLLDFGAARRVTGNRDVTNIITPGFAPFEQYHSQGNQGPWTDIYSLGAVIYWMTTGKRPVESAARVKKDTLLPAASLAEASVFGEALLQAVDWALHPDEARRPQNVSLLRAAIQGSEHPHPAAHGVANTTRSDPGSAALVGPSVAADGAHGASRRNVVCTIMFLDIVGYSIRSVDDQVAIKRLFNELMGKALRGIAEDTRIALDTGDGAAICFMGDPEEALHAAMLLRDLLGQRYGEMMALRIGLHMGPVRIIPDINDRINVVGDGINAAQRVMDLSQPNQVLVSRAYYEVISRITDDTASLFEYLGQYGDKHGRLHEVYGVVGVQPANAKTQPQGQAAAAMLPAPATREPLDVESVHQVELELAHHIGPLAKVLVHKAQPLAGSISELREALATSIQEPAAREAFIAGRHSPWLGASQPHSQPLSRPLSRPLSQTLSQTRPTTGIGDRKAAVAAGPSRDSHPRTATMASEVHLSRSQHDRSVPTQPRPFEPAQNEVLMIEQVLSRFIGPMAPMLVRREIGRCSTFKEFIAAAASHIDHPQQREAFVLALRQALPKQQY